MTEIGGYFEWEMPAQSIDPHASSSLLLKSGRSCLSVLLRLQRPEKLWVPYFICEGALEPVHAAGCSIVFYRIDAELEIEAGLPRLAPGERLLYVDYFGLKSEYADRLEAHYGSLLWLDQVQAFFRRPASPVAASFNSARKFFGVPDGAHLYLAEPLSDLAEQLGLVPNQEYRLDHLTLRLEGKTAEGYLAYQQNEVLTGGEPRLISSVGRQMLRRVDYERAAVVRRANYFHLHHRLGSDNTLPSSLLELGGSVPFCYPYLPEFEVPREKLWEKGIFVPCFWKECESRVDSGFEWEKTLSVRLLPLPIDQRYSLAEMDRVVDVLRQVSAQQ